MIKQRPRTQPTTRSRASNPHLVTRARALVTRVHASDATSRASSRQPAGLFRPLPFAAATATQLRQRDCKQPARTSKTTNCEFLQCTVLGQHGAVSDDATIRGRDVIFS